MMRFGWLLFGLVACSPLPPAKEQNPGPAGSFSATHGEAKDPGSFRCGGGGNTACPDGYACIEDPSAACDPKLVGDCTGVCVARSCTRTKTGGIGCADGFDCGEDPSEACDPAAKGTCKGVCRPRQVQTCGGFEAKKCPFGFTCVDDANDACKGDTCPGLCLP